MNIQFCCGENELSGFENWDTDMDVLKPLRYPDNVADFILCEHGGEHFTGPELLRFLDECHRIMKPYGIMRLCCPVITTALPVEHARDLVFNHGHKLLLTEEAMTLFLHLAGFRLILRTDRMHCDSHWKIIGKEKDDLETCRLNCVK